MDRKELKRNGGCRMANTGIIIVWKMRMDIDTGYSGQDIMMRLNPINGLYMAFLHKYKNELHRITGNV